MSILTDKEKEAVRGRQWFDYHMSDATPEYFDFEKIEGMFTPDNRMDWEKDWPGVKVTLADDTDDIYLYYNYILNTHESGIVTVDLEEIPAEFQAVVRYHRDRIMANIKDALPGFTWVATPERSDRDEQATRIKD